MGWACKGCAWTAEGDDLTAPIMHETVTRHRTTSSAATAARWGPFLGTGGPR